MINLTFTQLTMPSKTLPVLLAIAFASFHGAALASSAQATTSIVTEAKHADASNASTVPETSPVLLNDIPVGADQAPLAGGLADSATELSGASETIDRITSIEDAEKLAKAELAEQRYHYELAKTALEKNKLDDYAKNYAKLGDYPLVPYLDYSLLKQSIYDFNFTDIDAFLETHNGSFLEYRLREQLLYALANRGRWDQYLAYYRDDMAQKPLQCQHLYARMLKHDAKAPAEVTALWVEGKSQPKSCDALFGVWRKQGGLTDEVAWTRFHNAMQNNQRSLARYVSGFMSPSTKKYAEQYLEVHAYPARIKDHRRFAEQSLKNQYVISHGIQRFARIDPKQALYHWELYEAAQLFPKEISVDTKVELVKRLAYKGHTAEVETLITHSEELRQQDVVERLIREALRNQQYAKVLQWIDYLDEQAKHSDRWLYWRARAQDELGITSTQLGSREIYEKLSLNRSFYGFLSSDILNRKYTLEDTPSSASESAQLIVKNLPAMKRARELWLKNHLPESQAEWQFATKQMSTVELAAAGAIAREWGWYHKGIHAMISGNYWDDLDIRFPLAYRETVEEVSSKMELDSTFIYAIARQESAFSEKAVSSAGAMGLMQLMPGTALQTARKSGIKHHDSYLYDPKYNINLGSHYLNELLDKYNGNRILAAAAYNAGPHRVNTWIKKNPLELPFDVWIESIPFHETRGYVQNVLAFSVIYSYRLGQESAMVTEREVSARLWQ